MNSKIAEQHRSKPAYIYLRQSTPGQVRHHQESTERQYALREMAMQLGWSETAIRILDRDLGEDGHGDDQAGGLQDLGGGCLDGSSGRSICFGSLATGTLEPGLASTVGAMCPHPDACHRRRWLLRSGRFQRQLGARIEGHHGAGRAPFLARASRAVSSTKPRKASCVFHCPLVLATTSKVASLWTPMKKCGARWHSCFASFAKRVPPML